MLHVAREALAAREADFRAAMEPRADWYWEQDEHFRFTYLADSAERSADFHVAAYLGKTRWELPLAVTDDTDWAAHRALLERHEPFGNFEYARTGDDGTVVWSSACGRPMFDPVTERFCGYCGTTHDITRRRLTESALAESQSRLAAANARLETTNAVLERRMREYGAEFDAETSRQADARIRGAARLLEHTIGENSRRVGRPRGRSLSSDDARTPTDGQRILVVEDDPALRRLTLRRLRTLGYETLDAVSGPEAIQQLEAGAPVALVFSDVVMPGGMSGHDVAHWVRSHRPDIGVLLTSGYDDPMRVGEFPRESGTALLGKPYELEELACAVLEALDGRSVVE